jgi:hypothetical protein
LFARTGSSDEVAYGGRATFWQGGSVTPGPWAHPGPRPKLEDSPASVYKEAATRRRDSAHRRLTAALRCAHVPVVAHWRLRAITGAHREWLSAVAQLGGGGMTMGSWTVGHRCRLGGHRGAQQRHDARGGGGRARQWSEWADDDELLAEGEAAGAGTSPSDAAGVSAWGVSTARRRRAGAHGQW